MIKQIEGYFLLSTRSSSLLLHVNAIGKFVSEYYGRRLRPDEDFRPLTREYPFAEGTEVIYEEKTNPAVSLNRLKQEYSTPLKGDYGSPSLIIEDANSCLYDFVYDSFLIRDPEPLSGLPTPHGGEAELVVKLLDSVKKTALYLHYFVYEESDVIGRCSEIANEGEASFYLHKAMSFELTLPNRRYEAVSLYGSWGNEANKETSLVHHGIWVNSSFAGGSSARHNPFFLIKEKGATHLSGSVYSFNLVYSGNFQESLELDAFGYLRIQGGLSPFLFRKEVKPQERFVTPMAVMTYSYEGIDGSARHMHKFVNDCIVPPRQAHKPRPIVYNNWEATMFSFSEAKIVSLMKEASRLGAELFVLDDGWFGTRNSDFEGLGDWTINHKKLPGGLAGLAAKAKKLGLRFGIWMEPEMVNPKSRLYLAHPDWIIREGNHEPSLSRHQYTLDLTKKEVQDFVYESVAQTLRSAPISYLKWDYNRNISDVPGPYGSFYHDYILGLYGVLSRLTTEFPDVLFENCASGGNRCDLGMLSYFPQSWASDDTDSFQRLSIQSGLALGYPLSSISNHVAAKTSSQLLRKSSLESKFDVAAFGVLGYELDLHDLTPLDKKVISKQIAYYKEHRQLFQYGDFYELSDFSEGPLASWEVTDGQEALIGCFRSFQSPAPEEGRLGGTAFEEGSFYRYLSREESISLSRFGHLINMVSPVHLKEDGALLNAISAHKDMKSEVDCGLVSGAALLSEGVTLAQEWSGVGYSERVRLLGDFGARLYFLKKEKAPKD
jgi:alpha-galactosidase